MLLKNQIKTKKVNIIIFRTNKTALSILCYKPCQNCINDGTNIIKINYIELYKQPYYVSSGSRR